MVQVVGCFCYYGAHRMYERIQTQAVTLVGWAGDVVVEVRLDFKICTNVLRLLLTLCSF